MQIIADAGASKTDWRWISENGVVGQAKTKGINAYHISKSELLSLLVTELNISLTEADTRVYFYGAGCGSIANKEKVKTALSEFFKTDKVEVQHDLLAAARATCLNQPGVVCILGTGANACVFDGEQITEEMVSLGYVLGDEGSGSYIGKKLIKAYLENELPEALHNNFALSFPDANKDTVNYNIYQQPEAKRYLAGFFRFAMDNIENKYIVELLINSFQQFLNKSILKFNIQQNVPIHFVGGVAYNSVNILRTLLQKNNLIAGKFLESPIAGLTLYHEKKLL
ncbi:ATPase [Marivirga lumbricoides]|uniref:ATPase n=1 Tax=Marivirga lumbricoides TaxID=1046115 RepID=A0ABQ1M8R1_9BACT|nr:ATPase [Marivirga lumbricoides]